MFRDFRTDLNDNSKKDAKWLQVDGKIAEQMLKSLDTGSNGLPESAKENLCMADEDQSLKDKADRTRVEREERRRVREGKRRRKALAKRMRENLERKMKLEEKKFIVAQRRIQSVRMLEELFERSQVKQQEVEKEKMVDSCPSRNTANGGSRMSGTDQSQHVRDDLFGQRRSDLTEDLVNEKCNEPTAQLSLSTSNSDTFPPEQFDQEVGRYESVSPTDESAVKIGVNLIRFGSHLIRDVRDIKFSRDTVEIVLPYATKLNEVKYALIVWSFGHIRRISYCLSDNMKIVFILISSPSSKPICKLLELPDALDLGHPEKGFFDSDNTDDRYKWITLMVSPNVTVAQMAELDRILKMAREASQSKGPDGFYLHKMNFTEGMKLFTAVMSINITEPLDTQAKLDPTEEVNRSCAGQQEPNEDPLVEGSEQLEDLMMVIKPCQVVLERCDYSLIQPGMMALEQPEESVMTRSSENNSPTLSSKSSNDYPSPTPQISSPKSRRRQDNSAAQRKSNEKSDDEDSDADFRNLKRRFNLNMSNLDRLLEGDSKQHQSVFSASEDEEMVEEVLNTDKTKGEKKRTKKNRLLVRPTSSFADSSGGDLFADEVDSDPELECTDTQMPSVLDFLDDNFDVQMADDSNFVDRPQQQESPTISEVSNEQPVKKLTDKTEEVPWEEAKVATSQAVTREKQKGNKSDEFDGIRKFLSQMPRLTDSPTGTLIGKQTTWTRQKNLGGKRAHQSVLVCHSSEDDGDNTSRLSKTNVNVKKRRILSTSESEAEVEEIVSTDDGDVMILEESLPKRGIRQSLPLKKRKKLVKKRRPAINISSSDDSSDNDEANKKGSGDELGSRRNIRPILDDSKLAVETREAEAAEAERKKRLKERQREYNYVEKVGDSKTVKITKLILEKDNKGETIVEIDSSLVELLKPHQADGIKFMFDSTIESVEKVDEPGGGCILAHCMGLGKTLQVIALIHSVLTNPKLKIKTCLIVAPLNTVLNWVAEFEMWLREKTELEGVGVWEISGIKDPHVRAKVCDNWINEGGVMLMGYQMYQRLSRGVDVKSKRLRDSLSRTLVNPGPDMVFCDEGHMLKNEKTALSQALNAIGTQRRVCLTGTPLQNNLKEYHCMVNFVKPNLLGTKEEFLNRFVNPIKNGQHADSTPLDVSVMKRRAHVLHNLLDGVVQRKDYSYLAKLLPPKNEYVLKLCLSEKQIELCQLYLDKVVGRNNDAKCLGKRLFADFNRLQRVWTHPYTVHVQQQEKDKKVANRKRKKEELNDIVASTDEETVVDILVESDSGIAKNLKKGKAEEADGMGNCAVQSTSEQSKLAEEGGVKKHWWTDYIDLEEARLNVEMSGKMVMLMEIIRKCEEIGDKLLVFSQSLVSLNLIEDFLGKYDSDGWQSSHNTVAALTGEELWGWQKGDDYYRMDGNTDVKDRQQFAENFTENDRARLFLISTKAGSLGINLVAANRVIIFDASWNPSQDVQSIFRAYRLGQKKPVNVYRFIAAGTMEEKIYDRQVIKQSLAARVLDEQQIGRHFTAADIMALYSLDLPDKEKRPTPSVPKDRLLADMLQSRSDWIYSFHEHDSLLQDIEEEKLTETERRAAWEEYDKVKKGRCALPTLTSGQPEIAKLNKDGGMSEQTDKGGLVGTANSELEQIFDWCNSVGQLEETRQNGIGLPNDLNKSGPSQVNSTDPSSDVQGSSDVFGLGRLFAAFLAKPSFPPSS